MDLWNCDTPIRELPIGILADLEIPAWLDQDITPYDVAAIVQGGCDSGAYMPAVTYHTATATMSEYGDEVLDYIREAFDELPSPKADSGWYGLACWYLSCAVELWASAAYDVLSD